MILKPPRWNISPALVSPEARALFKGLAFLAPLWDVAGGKGALLGPNGGPLADANIVAGANAQKRATPYGIGVGTSSTSTDVLYQDNFAPIVTSDRAGTGDFTLVCMANPIAEARASVAVGQRQSSDPYNYALFLLNSNFVGNEVSGQFCFSTYNGTGSSAEVAGAIDGKMHVFGGVRRGTNMYAYVDGVLRASSSGTVEDVYNSANGFGIGNLAPSGAGMRIATGTNIVLAAGWNRALSGAEMRLLARDPFCMFRMAMVSPSLWAAVGGSSIVPIVMRQYRARRAA